MEYKRKTVDRWDIETNWGYGWDVEVSEYSRGDARRTYREYLENVGGRASVRLVKRREKITRNSE